MTRLEQMGVGPSSRSASIDTRGRPLVSAHRAPQAGQARSTVVYLMQHTPQIGRERGHSPRSQCAPLFLTDGGTDGGSDSVNARERSVPSSGCVLQSAASRAVEEREGGCEKLNRALPKLPPSVSAARGVCVGDAAREARPSCDCCCMYARDALMLRAKIEVMKCDTVEPEREQLRMATCVGGIARLEGRRGTSSWGG